ILFVSDLACDYWRRGTVMMFKVRVKILGALCLPMALILVQNDLSSAISFIFITMAYVWAMGLLGSGAFIWLFTYGLLLFTFLLGHIVAGLNIADAGELAGWFKRMGFGPGFTLPMALAWFGILTVICSFIYQMLKGLFILPKSTNWFWAVLLSLTVWSVMLFSWGATKGLKTYQKNRLVSFLIPKADPLGSGYNIAQSKIAIGSGGLLGRGYKQGSQTALGFLPERHTDFAFSALSEEMGFIGGATALGLLGMLFWRLSLFAKSARDDFGKLVGVGFLGLWAGEVSINLACAMGLFPVMGIGMPFLSYGGSRTVMTFIEVGILLSISRSFYVYK
ncbi:MAG: FtsW/RodA/SpoVE family cell cycle protein, partial [Elusimicrobiota bacterium]